MADPSNVEGCVQRTDRLERSLCVQKDEYEERLRLQKEECEERLRVQEEDSTTRREERLREQTEMITIRCEERLRVQKEEYEERLRVQKEEYEKALLVERDASVKFYWEGYYPLPLEDFPLEIIALIADVVHDFDDLANMALVSRRVHNGVLLSRQWIVVEEIVAATAGDVAGQRLYLHDRCWCTYFACTKGLLRCLRAMNLSHDEVADDGFVLPSIQYGHLDVLKYFHTTYALDVQAMEEVVNHAMCSAAPHQPVFKYLHAVMGLPVPEGFLLDMCRKSCSVETFKYLHAEVGMELPQNFLSTEEGAKCCLETLKYLHTEAGMEVPRDFLRKREKMHSAGRRFRSNLPNSCSVEMLEYLHTEAGFTAKDVRVMDMRGCSRECLVYMRDVLRVSKKAAHRGRIPRDPESLKGWNICLREVFGLEE